MTEKQSGRRFLMIICVSKDIEKASNDIEEIADTIETK